MLEEDLTRHEKFYLWRQRVRKTQKQVAAEVGVHPQTISNWERGVTPGPEMYLGGLEPWEIYAIFRRREKMSRRELAKRIGRHPDCVREMEQGLLSILPLIRFWGR
jgi:DNA-binding XRE family transcriptional regulator